jgi:hypothetical protein
MRLYRQEQPGGDWSGVITRVERDLRVFADAWRDAADGIASPVEQRH